MWIVDTKTKTVRLRNLFEANCVECDELVCILSNSCSSEISQNSSRMDMFKPSTKPYPEIDADLICVASRDIGSRTC